jgi:hypothetical protein
MKKSIIYLVICISLTSCARSCQSIDKEFQTGSREYEVIMYSGGDTAFYDKVKTIINSEEKSDGIYYYKGDTLIEVSGDYVLKSIK